MIFVHKTAEVSPQAQISEGTEIWHQSHIREGVVIGENCILGKGVYVDFGVKIGNNVKIQNYVSIFHGVVVEDGVFLGPNVCLTNDKYPRAVNPDGTLKTDEDWQVSEILVKEGASIGAGSIVLPGVIIGRWSMVGAGSVVTKDVPDHGLVYGNPARIVGSVGEDGKVRD
jgi:acetyltransferase-like isoleucine patch superfamily enzyme